MWQDHKFRWEPVYCVGVSAGGGVTFNSFQLFARLFPEEAAGCAGIFICAFWGDGC